jgi:phosphoglucomutase
MADQKLMKQVNETAYKWLGYNIDEASKNQIRYLLENDENELIDSFYQNLEFGTGGLRGIMGVGSNRVNIYTIGMATQGLCNYLLKAFEGRKEISLAIAYDCRNNSQLFAEKTAEICSANGIKVYLFESLRPTPELSFAIRHFGCQSGVVITASHNPKEYNGYKVYWEDGGQIIAPHDKNIINEVSKIESVDEVKFGKNEHLIQIIGNELDEIYTDKLLTLSLSKDAIEKNNDLKIVFTPIHGTGVKLVPMILKKMGFKNIYNVPEQDVTDGNFPTVHSPNPEETAALNMAMERAKELGADLVMGTDPDADRVGIIARDQKGELKLFNGNQAASILIYYLLTKWKENGLLKGKEYIVKTIVTTELITDIANSFNVEHFHVLTGFKYIADIIKQLEGKKTFIGGGEESYGYLVGEYVRDKDAVMSCAMFAEIAAWAKNDGKTLFDILMDIYLKYGLYKEALVSIVKKGKSGADEIKQIMETFRKSAPAKINNSKVVTVLDYLNHVNKDLVNGKETRIALPKSDVLQFILEDGSKVSLRPSGTEPKIKIYVSVKEDLPHASQFAEVESALDQRIQNILSEIGLN